MESSEFSALFLTRMAKGKVKWSEVTCSGQTDMYCTYLPAGGREYSSTVLGCVVLLCLHSLVFPLYCAECCVVARFVCGNAVYFSLVISRVFCVVLRCIDAFV